MGIEVFEFNGEGYSPLVSYNGWRVAIANDCERLLEKNLCRMERHLNTDEVFILLQGEAALHIGPTRDRIQMEPGKVYQIKCGEWHAVTMNPKTKIAIIENDDTGPENTEYVFLNPKPMDVNEGHR